MKRSVWMLLIWALPTAAILAASVPTAKKVANLADDEVKTGGQFRVKPIERPVEMIKRGPVEIAIGGGVIATLRQQEIPRGFEG